MKQSKINAVMRKGRRCYQKHNLMETHICNSYRTKTHFLFDTSIKTTWRAESCLNIEIYISSIRMYPTTYDSNINCLPLI